MNQKEKGSGLYRVGLGGGASQLLVAVGVRTVTAELTVGLRLVATPLRLVRPAAGATPLRGGGWGGDEVAPTHGSMDGSRTPRPGRPVNGIKDGGFRAVDEELLVGILGHNAMKRRYRSGNAKKKSFVSLWAKQDSSDMC